MLEDINYRIGNVILPGNTKNNSERWIYDTAGIEEFIKISQLLEGFLFS
jgi:hypothetical protein